VAVTPVPHGREPLLVILRALGLGDLLCAVPALRGLATAFPHHHRVLAAPLALEPLLSMIATPEGAPVVHELTDCAPLGGLDDRLGRPDVAVNLHGAGPQSHRVLLERRPRRLLAFSHPDVPESALGPSWRAGEHEVLRWCRMLEGHGVACRPGSLSIRAPAAPAVARGALGATVLHPGAGSAARRWPPRAWSVVARRERDRGREVLVSGGPGEVALARNVAHDAGLPADRVLAGTTDLAQLAALVGAAGRVVCGDTGVAHLATALGTPSVVLFGPTAPHEWGPPPGRARHRVLWAGKRGDPHGRRPDPGLLEITVDEVLSALTALDEHAGALTASRAA